MRYLTDCIILKTFLELQVNLIVQLDYLALYHISHIIGFHAGLNFARYCTQQNNNEWEPLPHPTYLGILLA